MKTAICPLIGALILACSSGVALAQVDHDVAWRTAPVPSHKASDFDAKRSMASFAACVVHRRCDRARSVVLAAEGSPEESQAIRKIIISEDPCLVGAYSETRMRFSSAILKGELAQVLLKQDYPDLDGMLAAASSDDALEQEQIAGLSAMELFGRCVTRLNPEGSMSLIRTVSSSEEERRAVTRLRVNLDPCLAKGATMKINVVFLRNAIGLGAYRLGTQLHAPNVVAGR